MTILWRYLLDGFKRKVGLYIISCLFLLSAAFGICLLATPSVSFVSASESVEDKIDDQTDEFTDEIEDNNWDSELNGGKVSAKYHNSAARSIVKVNDAWVLTDGYVTSSNKSTITNIATDGTTKFIFKKDA